MNTVSGHTFPGFEYTFGIPGANSTLTNGLGQAEPNFRLDSSTNELELAWVAGNASPTLISAFDPNHSFESEPAGGNRFVTSGGALGASVPEPPAVALLAGGVGILGLGLAWRRRASSSLVRSTAAACRSFLAHPRPALTSLVAADQEPLSRASASALAWLPHPWPPGQGCASVRRLRPRFTCCGARGSGFLPTPWRGRGAGLSSRRRVPYNEMA